MGRLLTLFGEATASAPVAFAPDDISGLLIWLDLSDTATVFQDSARTTPATADGDPVGGITDKSGTGRHHTQATGAKRPTLRKAAQNGLDVIEFDGTDDYLDAALGFAGLTAATCFLVVHVDADPPASNLQSGLWSTGSNGSNTHFPLTDGEVRDTFGSTSQHVLGNPATSLAQWNVYSVLSKSGEWTARLNGAVIYTTATNTVGWTNTANTRLGAGSNPIFLHDGHIGEFLVYDSELSTEDREAVEDYLREKWGTP